MAKIPLKMILGAIQDTIYCTGFSANVGPIRVVKRNLLHNANHGL